MLDHFDERIVCDRTGEVYVRLDAPVPLVRLEGRVIVEEAGGSR